MHDIYRHIQILILPLIISNVLHMLLVKYKLLKRLNHPIHAKAFGENKTWRGLLFLSMCNATVLYLMNKTAHLNIEYAFLTGALLGFTYMVFELPNSFVKRRLGIPSGAKSKQHPILFSLIDKTDSAFGVCLVYWLLNCVHLSLAVSLFVLSVLIHILLSQLLFLLKIKKSF